VAQAEDTIKRAFSFLDSTSRVPEEDVRPSDGVISMVRKNSQCSAERRGFSPGSLIPSHRECRQTGLELAPNWDSLISNPFTIAVLRDQNES
jgi:hypothetical protein